MDPAPKTRAIGCARRSGYYLDVSEKQTLTVALVSLGCPKNLVDSERILADLAGAGLIVGAPMDDADVIVVNTCGFLSAAREESLEVIREALAYKRSGRTRRVVAVGCLANRDGEKLYELAEGIDAIVGVHNRDDILQAVTGRSRLTRCDEYSGGPAGSDAGRFRLTPRHTAYLRISEGCSHRCTFCTIPDIRGPLRSKAPEDVLDEARELIADGAVELNIIGQDTTGYGADIGSAAADLADLLRLLDRLEGLRWLRLLYAYPRHFTDRCIAALAQCDRVVKYLDIPVQHIADDVLRRMGRHTTREQIESVLYRLRRDVPDIVLRTTLIVGFPGESVDEFEELADFVEEFRFDALGVFAYSPEQGTPAAEMPGQISDAEKNRRRETIMLAQQKIAFEANRAAIGRELEILVDGSDPRGYCIGRHSGQAPDIDSICILSEDRPAGAFIRAEVIDSRQYDLLVEPQ
ncbi:MAG: 30S ribosomal protein S12 methylthiotransferase RimO [Planctomycetes bacterium]|nr:30S ribosomal protein S12 methylthiotransferase RimO [Planctomycetota bacterium]